MRKHLSLFLVFLGLFFLVSCSSSKKPANDSDIIPDADSDGSDAENIDSGHGVLLQRRRYLSV